MLQRLSACVVALLACACAADAQAAAAGSSSDTVNPAAINLASASRACLERSQFLPARIGGCAVREWVRMPFEFGVRR